MEGMPLGGGSDMELVSTSTQTPIEIALGIDEDGMTTARALYDFFGVKESRFCKVGQIKHHRK